VADTVGDITTRVIIGGTGGTAGTEADTTLGFCSFRPSFQFLCHILRMADMVTGRDMVLGTGTDAGWFGPVVPDYRSSRQMGRLKAQRLCALCR
jgi:hypothetical protein